MVKEEAEEGERTGGGAKDREPPPGAVPEGEREEVAETERGEAPAARWDCTNLAVRGE